MRGPVGETQARGDARQPVARHPAHGRRMRVDALAAAILPRARIGLEGKAPRLHAQRLEPAEQRGIAHARQPLVDEHLRGAENDAAVGVVLQLLGRLVADAHRAHALEARQVGGDALLERLGRHDAVDRPQRALGVDGDVGDVVDVVFHGLRGAEAIERLDDEEGVAQPAVAVVPVALRAGRLGDRGRVRGDDGARLLEVAELQRDGGADDLGLALERDGERAHPVEPVVARALEELARGGIDGRLERLVGPQDQRDRLDQRERRLVRDVGEGGIGGERAACRRRRCSGCGWSRCARDAQGPP